MKIGEKAFNGCSRLVSVRNLNPDPQKINKNVFREVPLEKARLYVPKASVDVYKNTEVWEEFGSIIGI